MKCSECNGRGFIELEAGLIMQECNVCQGTGEIGEAEPALEPEPKRKRGRPRKRAKRT